MATYGEASSIGDIYGKMLNNVKHQIIKEGKIQKGEIGDVPLIKGGPQTTAGYVPAKIDKKTMSAKDRKDNLYNIENLSYDEDEETPKTGKVSAKRRKKPRVIAKESRKINKSSINMFMRKKSIFDTLYETVMPSGPNANADMEMDDSQELDALGIEGDDMGGEDEVTFTLDRATAEKLLDVIGAAMGQGSDEGMDDEDMGDDDMGDYDAEEAEEGFWDEDEEDLGASEHKSEIKMGKNNRVGSLRTSKGAANSSVTDKIGHDGDHGHALHGAKQPNMGKSNKVGNLKTGKSLFEQ